MGYSLDNQANITISGNTTFPFPTDDGVHTIQVFGNDSIGTRFETNIRYFSIGFPPLIKINSPSPDEYLGVISPDFNISITEPNLDTMWYTIDDGITNITFYSFTDTINQTEWDKLGSGPVTIRFYANDTWGSIGYVGVTVQKDIDEPIITINSPSPDEYFGVISPDFNISITEPNLDTMWYTIDDGITNITFYSFIDTINQIEWDKLSTGSVTIRFYANDTWGFIGYAEVVVQKDIDNPVITINSPDFNEEFVHPPAYNIDIDDSNLEVFWYTIDSGQTNFTITELTGIIDEDAWNAAENGLLTIRFYAQDKAGNLGYQDVIIIKVAPSGGGIPGFDIFVIIGILSIFSIAVIKRRTKFKF